MYALVLLVVGWGIKRYGEEEGERKGRAKSVEGG